jgi:hypothetical protein
MMISGKERSAVKMDMNFSQMQANTMLDTSPSGINNRLASLYRRLQSKAWSSRLAARLTGRSTEILSLENVLEQQPPSSGHYAGLRSVPIDQIRGSEARTQDFDRHFNPTSGNTLARWINVARARLMDVPLPPVELIEVGGTYFVRDGHHRVSVAQAFGEDYIEAEVTVWEMADTARQLNTLHSTLR